jgi:hypothetical protein
VEFQKGKKVITVFSAPNYCDIYNNKGAFIILKKDLVPNIKIFESVFKGKQKSPLPSMYYAEKSSFFID